MKPVANQKELCAGLVFVVAGVAFAVGATGYSMGSSVRPGPGYFPFGLGILTALVGAAIVAKAILMPLREPRRIGAVAWRPLLVIVGALVLFGLLLPPLGMLIALPVLVFVSAMAGEEFRAREALMNAVLITAASWAIFIKGLKLVIPMWPWFIQ